MNASLDSELGVRGQATPHLILNTRRGPLGYQDVGAGRSVVFFAGAGANGDLWTEVVAGLADRYRCVMVDLPLGAHRWPLTSGADHSAGSLARLILDVLVLLDVSDAVVVANDTAGGLCLLALAERHEGLERIGALVLTNCESFEHFPPRGLRLFGALCRWTPRIARGLIRRSLRSPRGRRRFVGAVASRPLDAERAESFFAPSRDPGIADDLVRAFGGFRPATMLAAAPALERFDRPVLLAWGDRCDFFPMTHADRLAAAFPDATVTTIAGARTWVPVDEPAQLAAAIARFRGRNRDRAAIAVTRGIPVASTRIVRAARSEQRTVTEAEALRPAPSSRPTARGHICGSGRDDPGQRSDHVRGRWTRFGPQLVDDELRQFLTRNSCVVTSPSNAR